MANKRYTVVVTAAVKKTILKLPSSIAGRLENHLLQLENDPRPAGCKKLKGRNAWRIRVGDYRIIYEIEDNILRIIVVDIGHRKDIYQ